MPTECPEKVCDILYPDTRAEYLKTKDEIEAKILAYEEQIRASAQ